MGLCTGPYKLMLFHVCARGSCSIELAHLKKEEDTKKKFARFVSSWFDTFVMFSRTTWSIGGHENT